MFRQEVVDWARWRDRAGSISSDELRKLAEGLDWEHERTTGSHHQMTKAGEAILPIPHKLRGHLALRIIKVLERSGGGER